jgi:D-alanyl-D-alanine carboxypeptidase
VSGLQDLTCVLRALLSGRLLPPRLLAEMLTAVPVRPGSLPVPLYDRYGLGLVVLQTPVGRLVGHPGGLPGFSTIVLNTPDGRQQIGIMVNVGERAPNPVSEAFLQGYRALGMRLLTLQGFD